VAVSFGIAEETQGKPFNAYVLVDRDGRTVGVYRKNYVTPCELEFYRRDSRRPVFEFAGLRVAVAICADCCQPELLASYGRRKVDLVLMPHAWDADPILRSGKIASFRSMALLVDAYARDKVAGYRTHNQMFDMFTARIGPACRKYGFHGVFVNQVGQPHPLIPCVGPSFLMSRDGRLLVRSKSRKEAMFVAEIPQF
jgi:predicted amidohydrolase